LIGVLEYEMTLTHVCTTNLTEWSLFMDLISDMVYVQGTEK